ncbi:MAG: hypothetical protein ACR2QA_07365, partial [Solirubrobacteraceae bacterium]
MVSAGEPAAALTPVVLLSSSGSAAFAASPCGANRDGNHACGVNSPSAQTGSLTTDNEQDYYVFSAQKNTELSVGLADGENPVAVPTTRPQGAGPSASSCMTPAGTISPREQSSQPNSGIAVPGMFAHTLDAGTYYLVVSGGLGHDANGNPTAIPYVLAV